jgi:MoaA/NifB/PqqE/SkfB family radical SAM enzyme
LGTVVTHQTLKSDGITGLIDLAQKLKVMLYFIMPVPAGRWANNHEMLLTPEDLEYIDGMTRSSPYLRTDFQANLGPYGCGAVKEILYLTPYGDVLACPFMHISLGNVFEEPISTIRNRALKNPYFATYHQKCLVSTDPEFMEKYLSKTFDAKQLPVSWMDVFPPEAGV